VTELAASLGPAPPNIGLSGRGYPLTGAPRAVLMAARLGSPVRHTVENGSWRV